MQRSASQEALYKASNPDTQLAPTTTELTESTAPAITAHHDETKPDTSHVEASALSTQKVTVEKIQSDNRANTIADTAESIKKYIRTNCAPALSIINTTFLVSDGSYQSSNRAALGFTAVGAASYLRGDGTVALLATGFAAYFAASSTCQRGFSDSVKAFVTTSTNLVTGACRVGITLFNAIKNRVSPNQPTADIKMKRL